MFKNLFSIVNIALVTLLVFLSVTLGYRLLSSKLGQLAEPDLKNLVKAGTAAAPDRSSLDRQGRKNKVSYQSITDRDLFNTKADAAAKPADDISLENLKETSLNLKLFGTITGNDNIDYAVIEDTQKRKQGLYKNGDTLQNAEIKMILRKKVVLNVNGKDEILSMEDDKKNVSRRPSPRYNEEPSYDPDMEEEAYDVEETVSIDREEINNSLKNINQLMSQVKVRPHFKDGKPNGLLLSHVQQNSIFKDMGLQNGDIVKGVNGKEIQSVDDALKFYDNLKSSSSVELQIERQGEQLSINYQIE